MQRAQVLSVGLDVDVATRAKPTDEQKNKFNRIRQTAFVTLQVTPEEAEVIGIARTRVEPVDEIADRLRAALAHIDAERLIAAPDCGLTMLDRDTARAKLANLAAAAKTVG